MPCAVCGGLLSFIFGLVGCGLKSWRKGTERAYRTAVSTKPSWRTSRQGLSCCGFHEQINFCKCLAVIYCVFMTELSIVRIKLWALGSCKVSQSRHLGDPILVSWGLASAEPWVRVLGKSVEAFIQPQLLQLDASLLALLQPPILEGWVCPLF